MEHQLFPHITRACKEAIFKTVDIANNLIGQTSTSKRLKVFSSILDKTFETERKYADDFKQNRKLNLMIFCLNGIMLLFLHNQKFRIL
ncbi:MAG: hypothetical protein KAH84_11755 [Thiomargarita sp.]|nr:hypothetical protein [Thiomargarita sp.]